MKINSKLACWLAVSMTIFCFSGCTGETKNTVVDSQPSNTENDHGDHSHADHDHADHGHADDGESAEIAKVLASLTDEDRESVLAQKNCLVGGEPLGSMGAPEKVDVKGTNIWICCEGCRDTLLGEPEKFIAKLETVLGGQNDAEAP